MSYAVRIHTLAAADTVEAALWYDAQVSGLGAEFLAEVDAAIERLAVNPEIYAIRFADVRRAPVHRFKFFGLFYFIRGMEVWVMAVFHGSRQPKWLRNRRSELG
jgi:toxin ParE1/3/4